MIWQGKIEFKKPITIDGKPHGVEHEATISAWIAADEGRVVHAEDTGALWFGTDTAWVELTPGGVGAHDHDSMYYTEVEVDGMFDGMSGAKQTVAWANVNGKPTAFDPVEHGNLHHNVNFLTSADLDFTFFDTTLSLVGNGASQMAQGTHTHTGYVTTGTVYASTDITYDNSTSGLDATDVKAALDELSVEKGVEFTDTLFVAKNGNDSNDGSMDNPFLTVQAAMTAAGALGTYAVVFVYPGTYEENLTLLPYVCIYAFGKEPTRIGTNTGTHTLTFPASGRTFYRGVNFRLDAFNITHTPGAGGSISVWFEDCSVGAVTVNGLGWGDYLQFRGSMFLYEKLTVHSAHLTWFNGESQVTLGSGDIQIEVDDDGAETFDGVSGQACTCVLRDIEIANKLLFEGKVTSSLYNCGVYDTITADGADTIVNYDNSSTPTDRADLIALNSATFARLDEAYAIAYDNAASSMTADNIQDAIDEVQGNVVALNIEAATFEALNTAGDVGTGSDQVSVGNHVHTAVSTTYNNADSGLTAVDVKDAIDEVQENVNAVAPGLIPVISAAPTDTPALGTMRYDSTNNTVYIYARNAANDADAWRSFFIV